MEYNAIYILNESDDKKITGIIRNINNVLNDPRLKGKLKIELVAFSDGVEMFKNNGKHQEALLKLKEKGVKLLQCERTLEQRDIQKSDLYSFVEYVPTGNGQIILRHYDGWASIHP